MVGISKIMAESVNGRRQRPACCVPGVRGAGGKYDTSRTINFAVYGKSWAAGPQAPAAHHFALNGMKNRGVQIMQTYPTGYAESHRMAEQIFREILPQHGMAVREEQIALCHEVLDTLYNKYNKEISLCEAGVGTGKTLAYLVACILWQMHRSDRVKLPIVWPCHPRGAGLLRSSHSGRTRWYRRQVSCCCPGRPAKCPSTGKIEDVQRFIREHKRPDYFLGERDKR